MLTTRYRRGYYVRGQIRIFEVLSRDKNTEVIAEVTAAEMNPQLRDKSYPLIFMKKNGKGVAFLVNVPFFDILPKQFVFDLITSICNKIEYPVLFSPKLKEMEWVILENENVDYLVMINMNVKEKIVTRLRVNKSYKQIKDILTGEVLLNKDILVEIEPMKLKIYEMIKRENKNEKN